MRIAATLFEAQVLPTQKATRMIHLTLYRGGTRPVPIEQTDFVDWPEIAAAIRDVIETEAEDKTGLLAIGPYKLRVPYRLNVNVEHVSLLALDVDKIEDLGDLLAACERLAPCLVYESPSSTDEAPRVRILAPVDRPMSPEECWPARMRYAEALGLGPGSGVEGCKDPSRIFFAGRVEGSRPRRVWEY